MCVSKTERESVRERENKRESKREICLSIIPFKNWAVKLDINYYTTNPPGVTGAFRSLCEKVCTSVFLVFVGQKEYIGITRTLCLASKEADFQSP